MTGACVMGSVCVMSDVMGGVQCVCVMGGVCDDWCMCDG